MSSIKSKLIGGFLLMILLLSAVSWLIIQKLTQTNERLDTIVEVSAKKISLSNELLILVLQSGRHEKNVILETNPVKRDYYKTQLDQTSRDIDNMIPELQDLLDPRGQNTLREFIVLWEAHKRNLEKIVELAYSNNTQAAFNISGGLGYTSRNGAVILLNRIADQNKRSLTEAKIASDEAFNEAMIMITAAVFLSIVCAGLIAFHLIRLITDRIQTVSRESEKIASREHSDESVGGMKNDEFNTIFDSLTNINNSFNEITRHAFRVASGDYEVSITPRSEKDILGNALQRMTKSLKQSSSENERYNWLSTGQNRLNEQMQGDQEPELLAEKIIHFLCSYTDSPIGAIYFADEERHNLNFVAGYAIGATNTIRDTVIKFGEGMPGLAASSGEMVQYSQNPANQLRLKSVFVEDVPVSVVILPFIHNGQTIGVIEIGNNRQFTDAEIEFLQQSMEGIAISVSTAQTRKRVQLLLEETQLQSEELQSQQEELRQMNEELEEQTQNLKQQQEELQITNEELEEQTQALEIKNKDVERAKYEIEQKTRQLQLSSKYKSEFLANMSHELRTPLNSILILSKDLADNKKANLMEDQVESADVIYRSGNDLLNLINEVLDLSKIEAGKMTVNIEALPLKEFTEKLHRTFKKQAEQKNIQLEISIHENLPDQIQTDVSRLDQIMKNLLSNALKFTNNGSVKVDVRPATGNRIEISVKDTGIGIPAEKKESIFEAFQQADGGTSRKYGGTGLGLSISRELTRLLQGELTVESEPEIGSEFKLTIPIKITNPDSDETTEHVTYTSKGSDSRFLNYPVIADDRDMIKTGDKVLLVIEDDMNFAAIILKQARQKGFTTLVAATGEDGLALTGKFLPQAIILDENLPGMGGRDVLKVLKSSPKTDQIPVHMISANDRSAPALQGGAIEFVRKPVEKSALDDTLSKIESYMDRKVKNVLVIEENPEAEGAVTRLMEESDANCIVAKTGTDALVNFADIHIDCIVMDLNLPDMSGLQFLDKLDQLAGGHLPPVIVYTDQELTREEHENIRKYAESVIIKGSKSEERLLDETALFLQQTINSFPASQQSNSDEIYDRDAVLTGKTVVVADDDMRNIFALSKVLRDMGMHVVKADNGKVALEKLAATPQADIVLMDIMMPEMDGYETMRRIRADIKHKKLPIIALTAKAMKEDKQKCIDAGANDYITKPVDVQRLLSLMRVWLSK